MSAPAAPVEPGIPPSPDNARSIVWPMIEERVRTLQPDLARVCLHHLGLTGGGRGTSKLVRSSLMMAAAIGLNVPPRDVGTEATAVELLHNSTLIHDDIIDDDRTRRGRPSAWAEFGVPLAVLAGDAMQAAGLRMMLDSDDQLARLFTDAIGMVLAGQTDELTLRADRTDDVARFEQVATRKTSALLECALPAAAVRASAPDTTLTALRGAGHHLGIAWQAANDLEDIWGDPTVTGKPARGDLKRRNLTLPVLTAMAVHGKTSDQLRQMWRSTENTVVHLAEIADLIEQAGGRHTAQHQSRLHLDLALECVDRAGLTAAGTDELRTLFHLIVNHTT